MPFFMIFILVPFAELMVFAAVSEHIGIITALFLALLTAMIGGAIVRHQGLQTLFTARQQIDQGTLPLSALFDGLCLVAAGALLITPGFITDAIGFSLLVPAVRNGLRHIVKTHTTWTVHSGQNSRRQRGAGGAHTAHPSHNPDIIEVEYEDITSKSND